MVSPTQVLAELVQAVARTVLALRIGVQPVEGAKDEMVVTAREQLQNPRVATEHDGPSVGPVGDVLDSRNGSRGEVGGHRVPVERSTERQPQRKAAVRHEAVRLAALGTQHTGRRAEDVPAGAVELAQAPEAGRVGDLGDRQIGVIQEPTSEVRPRGTGQPVGRHSEVSHEEATQVSPRHPEPSAELGLGPFVERAIEDQLHRAADQFGARRYDRLRGAVGSASQAGAVARGLGGSGKRESPDVLRTGLGGAAGPAVDPSGDDCGEAFHAGRYTGTPSS